MISAWQRRTDFYDKQMSLPLLQLFISGRNLAAGLVTRFVPVRSFIVALRSVIYAARGCRYASCMPTLPEAVHNGLRQLEELENNHWPQGPHGLCEF